MLIAAGRAPDLANANPFYAATPPPLPFVDLVGRLDGARARCRDLVVRPARPLGVDRGSAAVAEAPRQVVVDQPDALHERVDDRRADEPEAAPLEVRRQRVGGRGRGRDVAGDARRPAGARGGGGTIVARYASNDPNSAAVARNATALPIVASILAPLRTIPASAIRRSRSAASKAATTARIEAPERGPEGLALAQDRRPRQAGLERLEREPLEQLDVVVARPAPLVVVVGDHQRVGIRAVGAGPGAARSWFDHAATIAWLRGSARSRTACSGASGRPPDGRR